MKTWAAWLLIALLVPLTSVVGQSANTLVVSEGADVVTYNPIFASDGGSQDAGAYLWPLPFEVDPMTGLPVEGLTSWKVSDDGKTYTFTIRKDAVWSDGTPITSQDAKFTYDAFASDVVASPKISQGKALGKVSVVDDKTFQIVTDNVNCGIWGLLANMRWVPAHKFKADFSDLANSPLNNKPDISGGPYVLQDRVADEYQRYTANPKYWGGQPKIPQLVLKIIPDNSVRLQSLEAGDVDYASLSPDQFEQLVSKDKYNIASFPDYEITVLIMNQADPKNPQPAYDKDGKPVQQTPNPIFSDVRVRQAIVMGYDKDAVLATLGDGGGTRTVASIVPTITWAVDQELKPWAYDPKRAAELLDEAGWKLNSATGIREKDGVPLKFEIIYSTFRPLYEPLATIAQDQLSQLGMDIKLTKMEFGAFVEKLVGQTFDVGVVSFGDFPPPDPNGITGLFLDSHNDVPGSGFNVASYVNPKMDALIAQGLAVPGCATEKRAPIYNQIQQLTQQDVAYDFAMASNTFYLMSKRIDGFKPGPWNQAWNLPQWTIKPS